MVIGLFLFVFPRTAVASPALMRPTLQPFCPSGKLLFAEFDRSSHGMDRSRHIVMLERGELKSGTGFMFDWAANSLFHACEYLKEVFGEDNYILDEVIHDRPRYNIATSTLTFQPQKVTDGTIFTCDGIET